MGNPKTKRMVLEHIKSAPPGLYWFQFTKCRNTRSNAQNSYLFGCVYKAIQAGLEEAWGERKSVEWIHGYIKTKFLTEPVVNKKTGEIVDETVGTTHDMDTKQFGAFLDQIIAWAADYLNVEIPAADPMYSQAAPPPSTLSPIDEQALI